jgi:hypothetical protein
MFQRKAAPPPPSNVTRLTSIKDALMGAGDGLDDPTTKRLDDEVADPNDVRRWPLDMLDREASDIISKLAFLDGEQARWRQALEDVQTEIVKRLQDRGIKAEVVKREGR